ncbi:helicase-exonuclease AddAB subunit AddA [Carnobacterium inhibens]|uniref:ATP-dependent helicase/nuclease subunit A n=2 Tax=Carnobacterium inhibens TaxID=147709 RepID=U5S918_9LACT|nr:helicase-exonuclease AddAB subunit AddA [Carnobacterium inhibens]AGY81715.1 ATP-dependent helicase [Carnobacterium inhibens subsp. gilichinskyi]
MMSPLPLKPDNSRFTDGQWQAIYEAGHNILVSASAGSGKTTVLVQRVIEKIKSGTNVDEMLIVTYTEAAAKEMKARIQTAIQESVTSESDMELKKHLTRQVTLIHQASISTLHAFCLQVIRRYYYLINLDPIFRLLTDETEILLLKESVWEEVREELYGEEESLFKSLTASYSNDRSDAGLTDLIFSLYEFSRANPRPAVWLEQLSYLYQVEDNDLTKGVLYKELLKPQIISVLDSLVELSQTAGQLGEGTDELDKQTELVKNERTALQEIQNHIQQDNYQAAYNCCKSIEFARWKAVKKGTDEAIKETAEEMKLLRDEYKNRFKELINDYFSASPQEQIDLMLSAAPLVEEMARVAQLFTDAYRQRKDERNLLDFNDLEHLTLQILAQIKDEEWIPTEASMHYRDKFKEVMVDEYQDINQLQENILRWLAHDQADQGNLFMVGDVKQSIYSFRLADPGLFLQKYEQYEHHQSGERIILAENFRSRGEVLQFTNLIFEQLMDKAVGQMDYDEAAQLIQGFTDFPELQKHQPEILIYEKGTNDREDEEENTESVNWDMRIEDKTEGELLMVGQKIQELIQSQFPIYDKRSKTTRPISYRDIVLLTPTKKNNLVLMEMFKRLSIPLQVNDTQNYFQTTEITIMMSLLKVIDNPYQDIPLAAVLRSPIVGLDENELASIRISQKTGDYYEALKTFYQTYAGEEKASRFTSHLYKKVDVFLNLLNKWRELARRDHLVALIWTIYDDTGFLDYVGGMSSGKQRKANLHALYERAASYEKTSFKGLFQFVRFIEKMQEKDKDLAEPTAISEDENAVRVMTIHASKGLEFPVVFVLDLTKKFNLQDIKKSYVFNEQYGVGTDFKDLDRRIRYPSLPETALKVEKKTKLLSEEMRKLYVALTRAEEKLFLVGSYKDEETAWKEWGVVTAHASTVLPADIRFTASSLMKWIGLSLVRHPSSKNDYTSFTARNGSITNHSAHFSIQFYNETAIQEQMHSTDTEPDEDWLEKLDQQQEKVTANDVATQTIKQAVELMNYTYEHEGVTHTTSYQSVSEIKRLFEEPGSDQMVKIDVNQPRSRNRYVEETLDRPLFMAELTAPSSAEIGTATHSVMQAVDLTTLPTRESLETLIASLIKMGVLKEDVASKIKIEQLVQFFTTPLGKMILANSKVVHREEPFSLLLEAEKIFTDMNGDANDKILIHGIIDGYIELEDHIVLFDYKTDRVSAYGAQAGEKMLEKYKGQLNLYRSALESILDKKVTETYLCLLETGEIVSVPS